MSDVDRRRTDVVHGRRVNDVVTTSCGVHVSSSIDAVQRTTSSGPYQDVVRRRYGVEFPRGDPPAAGSSHPYFSPPIP